MASVESGRVLRGHDDAHYKILCGTVHVKTGAAVAGTLMGWALAAFGFQLLTWGTAYLDTPLHKVSYACHVINLALSVLGLLYLAGGLTHNRASDLRVTRFFMFIQLVTLAAVMGFYFTNFVTCSYNMKGEKKADFLREKFSYLGVVLVIWCVYYWFYRIITLAKEFLKDMAANGNGTSGVRSVGQTQAGRSTVNIVVTQPDQGRPQGENSTAVSNTPNDPPPAYSETN